jgi:hypothetical protein
MRIPPDVGECGLRFGDRGRAEYVFHEAELPDSDRGDVMP